jgi:hypothetical protein
MIISSAKGYKVEGAPTVRILCQKCNNEVECELYAYPKGLQLGFFWIPEKYKIGMKVKAYKCPICDQLYEK